MKKKNILSLLLALTASALLLSCAKEEEGETFSICPLGFTTTVAGTDAPSTRAAADATTDNLLSMGIFASLTHGGFDASSSTPDFMYNQSVTRTSSSAPWTYSPLKYWPGNEEDKLSFFAYAPHNTSGLVLSENSAKGFPKLTYTPPAAEASQTDLLAATPLLNCTKSTERVSFNMQHALTKVDISVKSADNSAGMRLTAFSIKSVKSGMLTYRQPASSNDAGLTWSYASTPETQIFTVTTTGIDVPGSTDGNAAQKVPVATFFLLPRGEGSTFSLTYTTGGTSVELNDQPLPALSTWAQGAYVAYTFGIEKKQVTIIATLHPIWTNNTVGDTTGSIVVTYTTSPTDPEWSNGGTGMVDGQPVTTHTVSPPDVEWEAGSDETINGENS